ncbi:cation diffusion facilitator family transporter [Bacillus sp. FJAT-50079]|uniref:cation diffusion facilitator family transporter n=1 Tax=Bacillus sp. FJAT-50079 TaxID=2833577 RepID=UPI001BC95058|nr:cation diffusion facilitator family transporter [Bacillus sp. FJAT-50079]MBS4208446.1 cation transporter [Bacillus sp. FJAT-50079]
MALIQLFKKGNTSSGIAALGNTALAVIKGVAFLFSGSGTMFASAMHSLADAVNQGFVFLGSALSEMKPSKRFPLGFGRVVNIFCMVAVIVVTIMAYETVKEGWHLFQSPTESSKFFLNLAILVISFFVDGFILLKAMKEIMKESRAEKKSIISAFNYARKAAPATRLVFYEDLVATSGAVLAIIGIVLSQFFGLVKADGVVSMLIGLLMFFVAFRVGYDNMVGLIGVAAPADVEKKVANMIMRHPKVVDIYELRVVQEGRMFHIDSIIELTKGMVLADADDIKFQVKNDLLQDPDIADVTIGIIEDDDIRRWQS